MKFDADNSFRVVQLSDIWVDGDGQHFIDTNTFIEKLLKKEQPNLIVITGDIVDPALDNEYEGHWQSAMEVIVNSKIPYIHTGGSLLNRFSRKDAYLVDKNFGGNLSWTGHVWNHSTTKVKGTHEEIGFYTGRVPIMDHTGTMELMSIYTLDSATFPNCSRNLPGSTCLSRQAITWFEEQ